MTEERITEDGIAAALSKDWAARLSEQGYCVVRGAIPTSRVAELAADLSDDFVKTPFCKGGFYGEQTKRFGRLLARSRNTARFVLDRPILEAVKRILGPWCDTVQLNLTQAIAVHPGAIPQLPHRDQDMWRGQPGEIEYLVNVMWPFTSYRLANGATLVWPGSHGRNACNVDQAEEDPVAVDLDPGDALIFLGSTLHGAGGNRSHLPRRGMIVSYCLGWLKPYENQWLAYPPEIARHFEPELAALIGYRQHRPNLGNFEGQCPSILLRDQSPGRLGAIDALRPDQQDQIADYVARQHRNAERKGTLHELRTGI